MESLFHPGGEHRFLFQRCNFIGKSYTLMSQEANKMDVALPLLSEIANSFDKKNFTQ